MTTNASADAPSTTPPVAAMYWSVSGTPTRVSVKEVEEVVVTVRVCIDMAVEVAVCVIRLVVVAVKVVVTVFVVETNRK